MSIRMLVRYKHIKLRYVKSEDNLADFFTKIQPISTFRKQRDKIMNIK